MNNSLIELEKEILAECGSYYKRLYSTEGMSDHELALRSTLRLVTNQYNQKLTAPIRTQEIEDATFHMEGAKAPSPDGFPSLFYHQYWDVIGSDIIHEVKTFFETGILLPNFTYTDIVMILKSPNSINTTQF